MWRRALIRVATRYYVIESARGRQCLLPCPDGMNNAAGDDASGGNTLCDPILCARDERVEGNSCIRCAPGLTNAAGDDASAEAVCDPIFCAVDERVSGNSCRPCLAGTTNRAGDDASGPDTICDPIFCGADQRGRSCLSTVRARDRECSRR